MVMSSLFLQSFLPFVVLILSHFPATDSAQEAFYRKIKSGGGLLLHVMSNETVSSVMECGHRCQLIHSCSGFNHKSTKTRKERNCQLVNGSIESIQQTDDSTEWTLYRSIKIGDFNQTCTHGVLLNKACPDGWLKRLSSCYYFANVSVTWDNARSICQSHGSDLFVPDDSNEQFEIWSLSQARTEPLYNPWIGVRLPYANANSFHTVHDVPISYSNFQYPEPNHLDFEFCVMLYQNINLWNNISCNLLRDYICERDQIALPN